jgi:hypothetical protein
MQVAEKNDKLNISNFSASVLNYLSWKEQNRSFQELAAIGGGTYTLTGRGDPEQFNGATISPSLLPILGSQPALGRGFREGDDLPGARPLLADHFGILRQGDRRGARVLVGFQMFAGAASARFGEGQYGCDAAHAQRTLHLNVMLQDQGFQHVLDHGEFQPERLT